MNTDTSGLKNYFNKALVHFMDPYTGWCGNDKGAGNILLCNDITDGYSLNLVQSPYQIPDDNSPLSLQDTVNLKVNSSTLDVEQRQNICSRDNIISGPCYGGLTTNNNSWGLDSGCQGTNPAFTYPTSGRLPGATKNTLPDIIDHNTGEKVTIGVWKKGNGWGPKEQKTTLSDSSSWTSKINFSTQILSPNKVSVGVTGGTPVVATVYINIVSTTLANTGLLTNDVGIELLCKYVADTIPTNNSSLGKGTGLANTLVKDTLAALQLYHTIRETMEKIEKVKGVIEKIEKVVKTVKTSVFGLVDEAPAAEAGGPGPFAIFMGYAISIVTTFSTNIATYIAEIELIESLYFAILPDIIQNMCKFYKYYYTTLECSEESGFLDIPKLFCHFSGYKEYLEKIEELGNAWSNNSYDVLQESIKEIYQICLKYNVQLFNQNLVFYQPVSVSYTMTNSCSIMGNSSTNSNSVFPFAKVGGICTTDGCSSSGNSQYCSCAANTSYLCPFEIENNNLTKCQETITPITNNTNNTDGVAKVKAIKLMRNKILYWFNSMVGTNGCFQRALGMKYGKCLQFNGGNLNITTWDPSSNKLSVNKNADTGLFGV